MVLSTQDIESAMDGIQSLSLRDVVVYQTQIIHFLKEQLLITKLQSLPSEEQTSSNLNKYNEEVVRIINNFIFSIVPEQTNNSDNHEEIYDDEWGTNPISLLEVNMVEEAENDATKYLNHITENSMQYDKELSHSLFKSDAYTEKSGLIDDNTLAFSEKPHINDNNFVFSNGNSDFQPKVKSRLNDKTPVFCHLCGSRYNGNKSLRRHIKTVHSGISKKFPCTSCSMIFNEKRLLTKHLKFHHSDNIYKCTQCNFRCWHNSDFKKHMRRHANNEQQQQQQDCPSCEFKTSVPSIMKKHLLEHDNVESSPKKKTKHEIFDEQSEFITLTPGLIEEPIIENTVSCHLCDFSSQKESELRKHLKTHDEYKPHQCSICTYRSKNKYDVSRHMLVHSGDRPLRCVVCHYRCKKLPHLKAHIKTHTEIDSFQCDECNFNTERSELIAEHVLQHSSKHQNKKEPKNSSPKDENQNDSLSNTDQSDNIEDIDNLPKILSQLKNDIPDGN